MNTAYLTLWIGCLSLLSIFLYWRDKRAARLGLWRVSEKTLHLASLLGGWPGAYFAQRVFRHKTIKQPFKSVFWITVVVNLWLIYWLQTPGIQKELKKLSPETGKPSISIEWSKK